VWLGIGEGFGVVATRVRVGFAFLQNHREVIVGFDLFTVPTVTSQLLYRFFVIEPGTKAAPYRYVILDRDSKFYG